ncbi:hypothetical protein BLNAU_10637 [Blattamonas nauphoetae]|uniref:Uncharacterized protein n=1 Tax=Blattamonas nauphoetae TaxID=2049346 RepID=A0ABQ9XRH3_9EUKA|nr:hypothetical protein BLNAU_10637 [Blattamonas nauphoetae]
MLLTCYLISLYLPILHAADLPFSLYPASGTPPSRRQKAVFHNLNGVSVYSDNEYVLYGGQDRNRAYLSDVFIYSKSDNQWRPLAIHGIEFPPDRIDSAHWIHDDSLFIWGGMGTAGLYSDLWKLDFRTLEWTEIDQTGAIPSARQSPAVAYDSSTVYLFGGRTRGEKKNDVFTLNPSTGAWTEIVTSGTPPEPHSSGGAYYNGGLLYVFGGPSTADKTQFSVFSLTIPGGAWNKLTLDEATALSNSVSISNSSQNSQPDANFPPTPLVHPSPTQESNALPPPSEYSSFVCASKVCYGFGGHEVGMKGVMTESLVILDLTPANPTIRVHTSIPQVSTSNSEHISTSRSKRHANMRKTNNIRLSPNSDADPILRRYAAAVTIDASTPGNIFVFGGVEDVMVDGDLFSIDLSVPAAPKYKLLTQSIDNIPSPRANHRTVAGLGKMWLFGGVTKGDVLLNDLCSFSFETNEWATHTNPLSPKPPARESFSFCEHSGRLFIFGGAGRGDSGDKVSLNDVWEYSIYDDMWSQLLPKDGRVPPGMQGSAVVVLHKQLHVFGGRLQDETVSRDLWVYSLVTRCWTKREGSFARELNWEAAANSNSVPHMKLDFASNADSYLLQAREDCQLHTSTIILDGETEERDLVYVCGGVGEAYQSILPIDRLILAPEYDDDQSFFWTTSFNFTTTVLPTSPILYHSYVHPVSDGFVSVGGLLGDEAVASATHWAVSKIAGDTDAKATTLPLANPIALADGSGVVFGRRMYMFGGSIVDGQIVSEGQHHNQMRILELDSSFACSPGTYVDASDTASLGCTICPLGAFARKFNTKEPTFCFAGSVCPTTGATRGYHCISCSAGSYSDEAGMSVCKECTDPSSWCPVGGRYPNSTEPTEPDGMELRISSFETLDDFQVWFIFWPYFGGAMLGVLIATILLACPCTRKYFWRLDILEDSHYTRVDRVTRSSTKELKKTLFGAFVVVIFVCFAAGTIVSVLLEFFANNKSETVSTQAETTVAAEGEMARMESETAEVGFVMYSLNRPCTFDDALQIEEENVGWESTGVECSPELNIEMTRIHSANDTVTNISCHLLATSDSLRYSPSVDCLVHLDFVRPVFTYDHSAAVPTIRFTVDHDEAFCHAMSGWIWTETNRERDSNKLNESRSGTGLFALGTDGKMMKGDDPTQFEFTLMRSMYRDQHNEEFYGIFLSSATYATGSQADYDQLYTHFGLHCEFVFQKDKNVAVVERVYRQKVVELIPNLFSTAMGFMGAFGAIISIGERLKRWNCGFTRCCCKIFGEDLDLVDMEEVPPESINVKSLDDPTPSPQPSTSLAKDPTPPPDPKSGDTEQVVQLEERPHTIERAEEDLPQPGTGASVQSDAARVDPFAVTTFETLAGPVTLSDL